MLNIVNIHRPHPCLVSVHVQGQSSQVSHHLVQPMVAPRLFSCPSHLTHYFYLLINYVSMGGASEAYGSRFVCVYVCVCACAFQSKELGQTAKS